jgi:hypothetical protein
MSDNEEQATGQAASIGQQVVDAQKMIQEHVDKLDTPAKLETAIFKMSVSIETMEAVIAQIQNGLINTREHKARLEGKLEGLRSAASSGANDSSTVQSQ